MSDETHQGLAYYIIDLETTGLSKMLHDIIEISIIRVKDKVQLNRIIKAVNPKTASFDALKITGKTTADLCKGIDIKEAIDDVDNFLKQDGLTPNHRCMVGHNVLSFDKNWVLAKWEKYDRAFQASYWVDTLAMSKAYVKKAGIPGKPSLKLHAACDLLGVKRTTDAHNAKSDTKSNFFLWEKLAEQNVDHLSFIKHFPHIITPAASEEDEDRDLSVFDAMKDDE